MTTDQEQTVGYHVAKSMAHAEASQRHLGTIRNLRDKGIDVPNHLNQAIGVSLKLADVHARLATALANSGAA